MTMSNSMLKPRFINSKFFKKNLLCNNNTRSNNLLLSNLITENQAIKNYNKFRLNFSLSSSQYREIIKNTNKSKVYNNNNNKYNRIGNVKSNNGEKKGGTASPRTIKIIAGVIGVLYIITASVAYTGEWWISKITGKTDKGVSEMVQKKNSTNDLEGKIENSNDNSINKDNSVEDDSTSVPEPLSTEKTVSIYNELADEYDSKVWFEELSIRMGSWRKYLAREVTSDKFRNPPSTLKDGNNINSNNNNVKLPKPRVLELSAGTCRNMKYYDFPRIGSITFMDASPEMITEAERKFRKKYPKYAYADFVCANAENFANGNDSKLKDRKFDVIVESFGLCAYQDPVKAVKEMLSALAPGGKIVLLEHGKSTWSYINGFLDSKASDRASKWGCRWNLNIGQIISDSGAIVMKEERGHFGSTWYFILKRKDDVVRQLEQEKILNSTKKQSSWWIF